MLKFFISAKRKIALTAAILAMLIAASAIASADGPTQITDIEGLYEIRNNMSGDYVLTNDLDFCNLDDYDPEGDIQIENLCQNEPHNADGPGWEPIGELEEPFTGTFDGDGNEIKNLFIDRDDEDYVGLFGSSEGEISNVELTDVSVSGENYVGGLVGYSEGDISNVGLTDADIYGTFYVGGLVGWNGWSQPGTIENSYSSGNISGVVEYGGGLVGYNSNGTIINSFSEGSIFASEGEDYSARQYIGGLAGSGGGIENSHSTVDIILADDYYAGRIGGLVGENNTEISNSYATGNISGGGGPEDYVEYIGGLVGDNHGTIENSYATGNVEGEWYVGGLAGYACGEGTIENSYATGNVEGDESVGGLVGYACCGTISNSYATGNVKGDESVGGLIGQNVEATITASFWDMEASEIGDSDGGEGKTTEEMKEFATFHDANWNIESRLEPKNQNDGYPYLSWEVPGRSPIWYIYGDEEAPEFDCGSIYEEGNGEEEDPYEIANLEGLWCIREDLDAYYTLTDNLDFEDIDSYYSPEHYNYFGSLWTEGDGWEPIGDWGEPFTGTLDGGGNEIKKLFIDRDDEEHVGLFGYVEGATIKDITIEGIEVTGNFDTGGLVGTLVTGEVTNAHAEGEVSGSSSIGGLVGQLGEMEGEEPELLKVENSSFEGTVLGVGGVGPIGGLVGSVMDGRIIDSNAEGIVSGDEPIGGLVGAMMDGEIIDSHFDGDVSGDEYAGGLVGAMANGEIINSQASGTVDGGMFVGGLVGHLGEMEGASAETQEPPKVEGSSFDGDVEGLGPVVGGLVGAMANGEIINSQASGTVSGSATVGGLVGQNNGDIEDSHFEGDVYGVWFVGGLVGRSGDVTPMSPESLEFSPSFMDPIEIVTPTIRNSHATGGKVEGESIIGGLVGGNAGEIENSYSTSNVLGEYNEVEALGNGNGLEGSLFTGGLVGLNDNGIIKKSYATGEVEGELNVGGLVGGSADFSQLFGGARETNGNGEEVKISDSYSTGNVSGYGAVGGFAGSNLSSIKNSYSIGEVIKKVWEGDSLDWWDPETPYIGGFVGMLKFERWEDPEPDPLFFPMNIPENGNSNGDFEVTGTIENSFWDVETSGQNEGTGEEEDEDQPGEDDLRGLTTAQMKDITPFDAAGWDIEPTSEADENNGYPFLSWQLGNSPTWLIYEHEEEEPEPTKPTTGGGVGHWPPEEEEEEEEVPEKKYTDTEDHWGENYIILLEEECEIEGYYDGAEESFQPDRAATRAEVVKMLAQCMGDYSEEAYTPEENPFPDVEIDKWYAPYINYGKTHDWIHGHPDGTFKPEDTINRVEALKIILRSTYTEEEIYEEEYIDYADFNDTAPDAWYASYLGFAVSHEVVHGYTDEAGVLTGYFGPGNNLTRAEAAKIIAEVCGFYVGD